MVLEYKVSLDNITFVGTPLVDAERVRALLIEKGFIKNFWQTPYKRYNDNYSLLGGGMLQITHKTGFLEQVSRSNEIKGGKIANSPIHQIRLEFNPNKINMYKQLQKEYIQLLKLMKDVRVTRKDIAVDLLGIDINDYIVLDFASRKRIEYKTSSMILETLYLGAYTSDERIRAYNKSLEQGIPKEQNYKWWRIEAQIRKEKAESMRYNPFTKVKVVYKNDLKHHDVRTRAMLHYLQANPDAFKELARPARSKYKKLLTEQVEEMFIDLEGMVKEKIQSLQEEIESWLNFEPREADNDFEFASMKSVLLEEEEVFTDKQRMEFISMMEKWAEEDE